MGKLHLSKPAVYADWVALDAAGCDTYVIEVIDGFRVEPDVKEVERFVLDEEGRTVGVIPAGLPHYGSLESCKRYIAEMGAEAYLEPMRVLLACWPEDDSGWRNYRYVDPADAYELGKSEAKATQVSATIERLREEVRAIHARVKLTNQERARYELSLEEIQARNAELDRRRSLVLAELKGLTDFHLIDVDRAPLRSNAESSLVFYASDLVKPISRLFLVRRESITKLLDQEATDRFHQAPTARFAVEGESGGIIAYVGLKNRWGAASELDENVTTDSAGRVSVKGSSRFEGQIFGEPE